MGLFDHSLERALEIQARIIDRLTRQLHRCMREHHRPKANPVRLVLTTIINNSKFIIMDLSVTEGKFKVAPLLLIDSVTGLPVADVVYGPVVADSSDETAAKVTFVEAGGVFPDGEVATESSIVITGVDDGVNDAAARPSLVTVKATLVSYTDSLGNVSSGNAVTTIQVTVIAVQTADGVELKLVFGPERTVITPTV